MRWNVIKLRAAAAGMLFGISSILCWQAPAYGQAAVTIQQIEEAWKARQRRIQSARFDWKETRFIKARTLPPPNWAPGSEAQFLPAEDLKIDRTASVSLLDGMLRYSYDGPAWVLDLGEARPRHYVSVFDGDVAKNLHGTDGRGEERYFPAGFVRKEKRHYEFDSSEIAAVLVTYRPCHPETGGVDLAGYRISPHVGVKGTHRCVILVSRRSPDSQDRQISFWVDPERDFVVLRRARTRPPLPPDSTLDISYARDQTHGWVPSGWKYIHTGGNIDHVNKQITARVTKHEINCVIPKSEFQIVFPPGTLVNDSLSGQPYIARKGNKKRLVTKDEMGRNPSYSELVSTESGKAGLGATTISWAAWSLGGAMMIVAILLCVWRWRRMS